MIDEKKLIEFINSNEFNLRTIKSSKSIQDVLLEFIEEQPKIGKWIPCSERLPEVSERIDKEHCPEFNVTIKGAKKATTLRCDSEGTWFDDHGYVYPVIAWQPLPDAYIVKHKEEKENE